MLLDRYEPQPEWYLHRAWGLHGMGHAARVLVWADQLGQWMNQHGLPVDLEVVRWAAVLHDVRRMDDGFDHEHGNRAAEWLEENAARLPFQLSEQQVECTCYCCRWHVPIDRFAPEMTPELACLKDADGLDRVRLGDLNPRYLRTPYARTLAPRAKELFLASRENRLAGEWTAAREAAVRLGLWR